MNLLTVVAASLPFAFSFFEGRVEKLQNNLETIIDYFKVHKLDWRELTLNVGISIKNKDAISFPLNNLKIVAYQQLGATELKTLVTGSPKTSTVTIQGKQTTRIHNIYLKVPFTGDLLNVAGMLIAGRSVKFVVKVTADYGIEQVQNFEL